jgi:hypothetical protein
MAANTDHTGKVRAGSQIGKSIQVTKAAKSNLTQTELNTMVAFINQTSMVVAIGDDTTGGFNDGASDALHIITEGGAHPDATSNFGVGSTGITTTIVTLYE